MLKTRIVNPLNWSFELGNTIFYLLLSIILVDYRILLNFIFFMDRIQGLNQKIPPRRYLLVCSAQYFGLKFHEILFSRAINLDPITIRILKIEL
jgi:hypothetical protein